MKRYVVSNKTGYEHLYRKPFAYFAENIKISFNQILIDTFNM